MKKIIILPLIAFFLCGCSKTNHTKPVLSNISFTASITLNNSKFVADANLLEDALELVINHPQEIKGLILYVDKDGIDAKFNDVLYSPDSNSLTNDSLIKLLYDVFNDVDGKKVVYKNENCIIQGKINNYSYDFVFSPAGLPISLKIKDLNLKINFTNVTIK